MVIFNSYVGLPEGILCIPTAARTMAIGYHTSDVFLDHPTAGFIRGEI
jgi:hypothetical protein